MSKKHRKQKATVHHEKATPQELTSTPTCPSSRVAFIFLWAVTVLSFIFSLNPFGSPDQSGKVLPGYVGIIFVANIFLGIGFFTAIFANPIERFRQSRLSTLVPILAIGYFLIYLTIITMNGMGFVAGMTSNKSAIQPIKLQVSRPTQVEWQKEIISDVNKKRTDNHLDPLIEDSLLDQSAGQRLQEILQTNDWSTKPADGKDYTYFMNQVGYSIDFGGESLTRGYTTPEDAVNSLSSNQTSKQNVLSPNFADIGVSVQKSTLNGEVVVIHFGKIKQTVAAPVANTDPVVNCTSSAPNCNGSTIKLPQSQCSQITCCQVGNTWSLYATNQLCQQAQNSLNNSQPAQQNTQPSVGNNYYCWNNAYGYAYYTSSGDQCNADNVQSAAYKLCTDTQKLKLNTCNTNCKTDLDKADAVCAWAYTGPNAAIANDTTKYGDCLNGPDGAAAHYATCLSQCSSQFEQGLKQCAN